MAKPPFNRVRIIGGRHRGRVLRFPGVPGLRPTPDRVRETLFNWLGQDLDGRSTLEPYAGSGALSLEALSRGASLAVAVDRDGDAVRALEANARSLGVALETHRAEARAFIERETRRFDVVFLDPPFGEDPWPWLLPAAAARLASPGALVYAEARRRLSPPDTLAVVREGRAGQVHYHLLAPTSSAC
jgi:16S rRNA (guanine966-N2)-methyltransferase